MAGGINTFGYVGGDPITRFDFFGLEVGYWSGIESTSIKETYQQLSECEQCKIKAQAAFCPFTGFGMGRLGVISGGAIGSAIPGIGTATGSAVGGVAGFIGGVAVCNEIKSNACECECGLSE